MVKARTKVQDAYAEEVIESLYKDHDFIVETLEQPWDTETVPRNAALLIEDLARENHTQSIAIERLEEERDAADREKTEAEEAANKAEQEVERLQEEIALALSYLNLGDVSEAKYILFKAQG